MNFRLKHCLPPSTYLENPVEFRRRALTIILLKHYFVEKLKHYFVFHELVKSLEIPIAAAIRFCVFRFSRGLPINCRERKRVFLTRFFFFTTKYGENNFHRRPGRVQVIICVLSSRPSLWEQFLNHYNYAERNNNNNNNRFNAFRTITARLHTLIVYIVRTFRTCL